MRWIRSMVPCADGAPVLVCFPHAGGSANVFRPLAVSLAPRIRVVGVQYPGRQDRRDESPLTDIREMARHIVDELAESGTEPIGFLGHSMGAIVAFETARLGAAPRVIFASAARAPGDITIDPAVVSRDDALIAEIVALGATPREFLADPQVREMILPGVRGDYRALSSYVAVQGARTDADLVAIVGDVDPRVRKSHAAQWFQYTSGAFTLHEVAGDHFYLIPNVQHLAGIVEDNLPRRAGLALPVLG